MGRGEQYPGRPVEVGDFMQRCSEAALALAADERNDGKTVVCVGHGATTEAFITALNPAVYAAGAEYSGGLSFYTSCTFMDWAPETGTWELGSDLFSTVHCPDLKAKQDAQKAENARLTA
jgi:broad specificity phosphatase PhoE